MMSLCAYCLYLTMYMFVIFKLTKVWYFVMEILCWVIGLYSSSLYPCSMTVYLGINILVNKFDIS